MIRVLARTLGLLLLAASLGAATALAAPDPIDVVFDIDWTIVSSVAEETQVGGRVIEIEGLKYRLMDGLEESLNLLLSHPHVRVSFFSGGRRSRNDALLKRIVLDPKSGLTAYDVAYRRLSFDDLLDLGKGIEPGIQLPFADRYKKDLAPHFGNLSRVILVDDNRSFAVAGQEANLLWLGKTYVDFPTWADTRGPLAAKVDPKYLPPSLEAWELDRHRIPVTVLAIDTAIRRELAEPAAPGTFVARVQEAAGEPKARYLERWKAGHGAGSWRCQPILSPSVPPLLPHG